MKPKTHHFVQLNEKPFGVTHYEYKGDGKLDWLRLSVFMSRDNDFTNIWFGLLDPMVAESKLNWNDPSVNFHEQYYDMLFKGYLSGDAETKTVLKALRIGSFSKQRLYMGSQGLTCQLV